MESNFDDLLSLEKSIKSSSKIFDSFYDTNRLEDAIGRTDPYIHYDLYYSAVHSILSIFKSVLTLDPVDIENATESATQTAQLCDRYRKRGFIVNIMKYLRTPDYNQYNEIELHAELIFGLLMGYSGLLGFVNSHSVLDFIKIVNRLRLSKNSFKECRLMYSTRKEWESETTRVNFESAIRLERGARHLIISLLPPKVLKLVNFFGYRGVRSIALNELNAIAFQNTGMISKMSETLLLIFHNYIETFISAKQNPSENTDIIVNNGLNIHPNSIAYKLFSAKSYQTKGQIEAAITNFENCLNNDCKDFNLLSYFELIWCHTYKQDWDQCIKYSKLLKDTAFQSPTIFTYLEAVFKYIKSVETNDLKLKEEASELFRIIPTLRTLYFGFTPTFELMATEYSKLYFVNNQHIVLPEIELLYSWNYFINIFNNISLLEGLLKKTERELRKYGKTLHLNHYADNYYTALFYKGVILKFMSQLDSAQECFDEIMREKDRLKRCQHLIPQTIMEMGLIQMLSNNFEEAKQLLNQTINDFGGYLSEFVLHIRIYPALAQMGVNTDMTDKVAKNIEHDYRDLLPEVETLDNDNNRGKLFRL